MSTDQPIGGARTVPPMQDETCYPLNKDEFLIIKENIVNDKFTNWESFLVTSSISGVISFIISLSTLDLIETNRITGSTESNGFNIFVLILYGTIGFGSLFAFIVFRITKTKSKSTVTRLEEKISHHLEIES